MKQVCDFLGIPSGCDQTDLLDYAEKVDTGKVSQ